MQDKSFVPFTREMKKEYTILVPNMLPTHFELFINVFRIHGYNMKLLTASGPKIAETGLRFTHNDTCYPAILVIGQFMDALLSGEYDPKKTALIMFQTGGGCRASNYISLIRKALIKAGMEYVPVISFSLAELERHPGFRLTVPLLHSLIYAVLYGDLLMSLRNQVRPYETEPGAADRTVNEWVDRLGIELGRARHISYRKVKKNYREIVRRFAALPTRMRDAVKVGIVGEIFVKYSPLGNNDLERFLVSEGAEPVVPGLLDFCLYAVYNSISDYRLYRKGRKLYPVYQYVFRYLCKKKRDLSAALTGGGFSGLTPFETVVHMADDVLSSAVKMGEGWLLTAEMVELSESGCRNIVCTQPFGCLPNHICGKGMMKPLKEFHPDINIVAVDYDAGSSRVNQENRLKLMLANARRSTQASVPDAVPEIRKEPVPTA